MFGIKPRNVKGISLEDIPTFNPNQSNTEDNSIFALGIDKEGKLVRRGVPGFGGSSGGGGSTFQDVVEAGNTIAFGNGSFRFVTDINPMQSFEMHGEFIAEGNIFEADRTILSATPTSIEIRSFNVMVDSYSSSKVSLGYIEQRANSSNGETFRYQGAEFIEQDSIASLGVGTKIYQNPYECTISKSSGFGNPPSILSVRQGGIRFSTNNFGAYSIINNNNITANRGYEFPDVTGRVLLDNFIRIPDNSRPGKDIRVRMEEDGVLRFIHQDNSSNGILNINPDSPVLAVASLDNTRGFSFGKPTGSGFTSLTVPDITFGTLPAIRFTLMPFNSSAVGAQGEMKVDASFLYICIAPNTWRRVALGAF